MTPSESSKSATAALQQVLRISPGEFNAEGAASIIEQAIRKVAGERETGANREREVQAAAQERLARLLSASPAVIYSFKATGDYAPLFVSNNILDVFGYTEADGNVSGAVRNRDDHSDIDHRERPSGSGVRNRALIVCSRNMSPSSPCP